MTRPLHEALLRCAGTGAVEIWVKDAHGTGRNLTHQKLPIEAKLIRGWSGHPYAMVQELDSSFDAVVMVGYQAPAAHPSNPLSHTNKSKFNQRTLNGQDLSEYLWHAHTAALEQVPVVFLSGAAHNAHSLALNRTLQATLEYVRLSRLC